MPKMIRPNYSYTDHELDVCIEYALNELEAMDVETKKRNHSIECNFADGKWTASVTIY